MLQKKLKTFCGKSHCVFKELKGGPFEHTKICFRKMFFFLLYIHKNCILYQLNFFSSQNMHIIKKEGIFDRTVFKLQRFS